MNLAVIPARFGSKRIPKKNIKNFLNKPIISYSIEAAIRSKCFDKVIVSTDSDEISLIAKNYGAEVPFVRPQSLSDDDADTLSVVRHAIKYFESKEVIFKNICCIYATAPLITPQDIIQSLKKLDSSDVSFSMPVTKYPFPIQRAFKIECKRIRMFNEANFSTRSQDLDEAWHDAGQFYWGKAGAWLDSDLLFGPSTSPIILPSFRVQDIDTEEDWKRAEILYNILNSENSI
jgi:pseudaminic acid cytidylyltransferase